MVCRPTGFPADKASLELYICQETATSSATALDRNPSINLLRFCPITKPEPLAGMSGRVRASYCRSAARKEGPLLTLSRVTLILCIASALLGAAFSITSAGEMEFRVQTGADALVLDGVSVRIAAEGAAQLTEPGEPALPYRIVSVVLPQGLRVEDVRFEVLAWRTAGDAAALQPAPELVSAQGERGPATGLARRSKDGASFPGAVGRYLGTGYLHGYAIASFAVFPVRVSGTALLHAEDISVRVTTGASDAPEPVTPKRHRPRLDQSVRRQLSRHVINPGAIGAYQFARVDVPKERGGFQPTSWPSLEGSPVDYVIICNDSMSGAWQTLADWKTAKGVPTVIRTTEWIAANYPNGVDLQETIRRFVVDAYQKWGITYVLLGGDTDQIPARLGATFYLGNKDVPVDMYYGCVDGDWNADHDDLFGEPGPTADAPDLYQEVYVGRLPAENNIEVAILTDKVISYETPRNTDYQSRVLMLAEVLFPTNWDGSEPTAVDGASLNELLYTIAPLTGPDADVSKQYENHVPYPDASQETLASTIDSINAGYNFANHIGHGFRFNMSVGNGSLLNSDADAFTNTDRYTNFYLLNCTAVAYTYFCLAEHMLKNPIGGAVSTVGANESAFPISSQPYMNEYWRQLFTFGTTHIGEVFVNSRLPRTTVALVSDNVDAWTHYIYTILADPEMMLYTGPIETFEVAHVSSVGLGPSSILVTVTDSSGPVAGADVCFSKDDDDYAVGTTDGAGQVTLAFTAESAGEIRVVVTGRNHGRHEGKVDVLPGSAAYVSVSTVAVDDDNIGGTQGNGDGLIDGGEIVDLTLSVENTGGQPSGNVTLKLRTGTVGVAVFDSVAAVGVVASGGTVVAMDAFRMVVSSGLPDEYVIECQVAVENDGLETWWDSFRKLVHAPELSFVTLRIDDTILGNGDGVNQPNEEFKLYYDVKNFGTGTATGLNAILQDVDGGFVIADGSDVYPTISAGQLAANTDGFQLREPDTSVEHNLRLTLIDSDGRVWVHLFELRAPAAPTSVSFDPSLGPHQLRVVWNQTDPAAVRYNVYRSVASGGPWALANPDPVDHTVFVDRGLQPTTRYYYTIAGIDTSGNESAPSPVFSASTNPGQVQGWPIAMQAETVSSPVIGDIDGDQDFEIIQGNNYVYAWNHDGVELRDADGNAQTWGLFSTEGRNYVSHIALAKVDGQPGFEIVAASRTTREIFVLDHTGAVVAGWPRPVENPIRSAMVAGDIDDDGLTEIIALDELGVMYVWRNSGAEYRDGDANPLTDGVFKRFPNCFYQYGSPAVADIDNDGINEIVVGTHGDEVYVLNEDGSDVPGWPRTHSSDISGSVAVGDLDGNGDLEIVLKEWGGLFFALNHDASVMFQKWFPNQQAFGPSPALGDLDGNGTLEAVIPSNNGKLYAVQHNGAFLPGWPVTYSTVSWTESSPIIGDLDNNGFPDVILGDETRFINGWDYTGNPLAGFPLKVDDAVRGTLTLADCDKDGDADLIAAGWDKFVYVWDFPEMFNPHLVPWGSMAANLFNDGNAHTALPIGIVGASFSFVAQGGTLELMWVMPGEAGYLFDIDRAVIEGQDIGDFTRVAEGVPVSADGVVHYFDNSARPGKHYVYRISSVEDPAHTFTTTSVYVPVVRAALDQNYPNPFNPATTITYTVPDAGMRPVSLVIYDVRGARVRTLVDGMHSGGRFSVDWNGRNDAGARVSSGMYFYRLEQPGFTATRKMLLIK